MRRWVGQALAFIALSCGAMPEGDGAPGGPPQGPMPSAEWCAANRCVVDDLTFAPEPGLEELTAAVAERFANATGLDVRIDPAGIPVRFEEHIVDPGTGGEVCGATRWMGIDGGPPLVQEVVVDPTPLRGRKGSCPVLAHSLAHEFVHTLAPESVHTESGLFAAKAEGNGAIDLPALLSVCSELPCAFMRPE